MKVIRNFEGRILSYFFILLIINYSVGCNSYYKVLKSPAYEVKRFVPPEKTKSRFIIHHNDELYVLRNIIVDSLSISGEIDSPGNSLVFYSKNIKSKRYDSRNDEILDEVHIYLKQDVEELKIGSINILLSEIIEIRFIVKDEDKTGDYKVVGIFAIVGGVILLGFAIAFVIASSMNFSSY